MCLGIDVHRRYAQVAVVGESGKVIEEFRVDNANLNNLAQQYTSAQAALEATNNRLSRHLDVTVAHQKINQIVDTEKKPDHINAK